MDRRREVMAPCFLNETFEKICQSQYFEKLILHKALCCFENQIMDALKKLILKKEIYSCWFEEKM